jgi:hypothetical protein
MSNMTSDPIEQIAATALSEVGTSEGKVLLYAEVEDGVISADLFHQRNAASPVLFRFASEHLRELAYRSWVAGAQHVVPQAWQCASLSLSGGSFSLELVYPNQLAPCEDLSDRRPRAVAAHFPGARVDYSAAHG